MSLPRDWYCPSTGLRLKYVQNFRENPRLGKRVHFCSIQVLLLIFILRAIHGNSPPKIPKITHYCYNALKLKRENPLRPN